MSLMEFLCLFLFFQYIVCDDMPTAYEVLQEHDFPIGLLPEGVIGYELNKSTGQFSVYLNGMCSFAVENFYTLEYKSTIKGVMSKGRLKNLEGVSVKVLFFWFNIVEVVHEGDQLQFSVGIVSASLPVGNFSECPQCGCGYDSGNGRDGGIKLNRFVSFS